MPTYCVIIITVITVIIIIPIIPSYMIFLYFNDGLNWSKLYNKPFFPIDMYKNYTKIKYIQHPINTELNFHTCVIYKIIAKKDMNYRNKLSFQLLQKEDFIQC